MSEAIHWEIRNRKGLRVGGEGDEAGGRREMEQRQQVREPPPAPAPGALPVGAARQRRVASPQHPAPSGGALARPNASSPRPPGVPASTAIVAIVAGMPAMGGGWEKGDGRRARWDHSERLKDTLYSVLGGRASRTVPGAPPAATGLPPQSDSLSATCR